MWRFTRKTFKAEEETTGERDIHYLIEYIVVFALISTTNGALYKEGGM